MTSIQQLVVWAIVIMGFVTLPNILMLGASYDYDSKVAHAFTILALALGIVACGVVYGVAL